MIQKIKSENNRNGRDHLTLFRWPLLPLCAEHGTNLAGASPVTGIYRQV